MTSWLKYLFLAIYILVDVIYITFTKPVYNARVKAIQGKEMVLKQFSYLSAILSYIILGAGWLVIVANHLTPQSSYMDIIYTAVLYGLVVYGVFNTTLYVMFEGWDVRISIRDTLWGVGWITLISTIYLYTLKTKENKE